LRFGAVSSVFAGRIDRITALMDHELDKNPGKLAAWTAKMKNTDNLLRYFDMLFREWSSFGRMFWGSHGIPTPERGLLASESVRGERLDFSSAVAGGVAARAMAVVPAHLSRSVGGGEEALVALALHCWKVEMAKACKKYQEIL